MGEELSGDEQVYGVSVFDTVQEQPPIDLGTESDYGADVVVWI